MRIAVIPTIRDYSWGAPGHCMRELVRILLKAGHDVLWFVAPVDLRRAEVSELAAAGANVRSLPPTPPGFVRLAGLRNAWRNITTRTLSLASQVDAFCPDHVFLNQGGTYCGMQPDFSSCLAGREGNYSLICHLNHHQPPFSPARKLHAQSLIAGAKRVFMPSNWVQQLAETQIASSIPNAARFLYPMRFAFEAPLPWPATAEPRIAMVNRLDVYHKGMDCAFQALATLREEGLGWALSIYGSGPDEDYLKALARHLRISDSVTFCGYTEDLPAVWSQEELMLLPSRFEGSAVALTEAMGFGRPVVATAVGGAPQWVDDGQTGFLCPATEPDLLAGTLRRALSERPRWRELGLRAHEKIKRLYPAEPAVVFLEALN